MLFLLKMEIPCSSTKTMRHEFSGWLEASISTLNLGQRIYIYIYIQDTLCLTEWLQYSFIKSCIQELLSVTFSIYCNIDLDQTYGARAVFSWTFEWNLMGSGKTDWWLILKNLRLSEIYTNLWSFLEKKIEKCCSAESYHC